MFLMPVSECTLGRSRSALVQEQRSVCWVRLLMGFAISLMPQTSILPTLGHTHSWQVHRASRMTRVIEYERALCAFWIASRTTGPRAFSALLHCRERIPPPTQIGSRSFSSEPFNSIQILPKLTCCSRSEERRVGT